MAKDDGRARAGGGWEVAGLVVKGEPGEEREGGGFDHLRIPAVFGGGLNEDFGIEFAKCGGDAFDEE